MSNHPHHPDIPSLDASILPLIKALLMEYQFAMEDGDSSTMVMHCPSTKSRDEIYHEVSEYLKALDSPTAVITHEYKDEECTIIAHLPKGLTVTFICLHSDITALDDPLAFVDTSTTMH